MVRVKENLNPKGSDNGKGFIEDEQDIFWKVRNEDVVGKDLRITVDGRMVRVGGTYDVNRGRCRDTGTQDDGD